MSLLVLFAAMVCLGNQIMGMDNLLLPSWLLLILENVRTESVKLIRFEPKVQCSIKISLTSVIELKIVYKLLF